MIRRLLRVRERAVVLAVALLLAGSLTVPASAGLPDPPEPALAEGEARVAEARVVLSPVARVAGGTVTLAEIARLEGSAELTERLREVTVGPAPLPGRSRWIETAYLNVRLRQAGIDPTTVRLEGPERIELVTPSEADREGPVQEPAGRPAPPEVARGETLVLEAVAGSVAVRVPARALRSGRLGERIPVINLSSGREVEAVVVGPGRVRVEVAH